MAPHPTGDSKSSTGLQCASAKLSKVHREYFQEQKLVMMLRMCKIWSFSHWIFGFEKTAEVALVTFQWDRALPLSMCVWKGGGYILKKRKKKWDKNELKGTQAKVLKMFQFMKALLQTIYVWVSQFNFVLLKVYYFGPIFSIWQKFKICHSFRCMEMKNIKHSLVSFKTS